jgi:hypothetical protein
MANSDTTIPENMSEAMDDYTVAQGHPSYPPNHRSVTDIGIAAARFQGSAQALVCMTSMPGD